jgi:hypothetical protein
MFVLELKNRYGFLGNLSKIKRRFLKRTRKISKGMNEVKITNNEVQKHWTKIWYSKRNLVSKNTTRDSNKHWSNSFQLVARVDGNSELGEVRRVGTTTNSLQRVMEKALHMENSTNPNSLDKGESKLGEEHEVLMKGFLELCEYSHLECEGY